MSDDPWDEKTSDDGLGSLAQSARKSSLTQARIILMVLGVLCAVVYVILFFLLDDQIEKARRQRGVVVDESIVRLARIECWVGIGLGVLFVVLGLAVYKAPVACTVTGLSLYLAMSAIAAVANTEGFLNPCALIVRVLIIVGLAKAVQAAVAYQREVNAERRAGRRSDDDYGD